MTKAFQCMSTLGRCYLGALALLVSCQAFATSVEGFTVKDTLVVDGAPLLLNGAAYRKRGYSKFSVEAIYVTERKTSLAALSQLSGPKRILITAIRDVPGATIARHFVSDLRQQLTEAEFKTLVTEIGQVGAAFGSVHNLQKGDQVAIDWLPGRGMTAQINAKPIIWEGGSPFIKSELLFNVIMRNHCGPSLPIEFQKNMLGLSTSMQDNAN